MYNFLAVFGTLVFLFITLLLIHNLTVFIHELGHAIPKLLFTKSKVSIYLGTYGDNEKSIKINLGILEIYIKKHLFWSGGLCIGTKAVKHNWQNIIIVFCGPIASILIAILSIIFIKHFQLINFYMILAILFLMSSVFDLFHNLIPDTKPILLKNGNVTYNDGQLIKRLFKYSNAYALIKVGNDYYNSHKYKEAVNIYKEVLNIGYESIDIIRLIIAALIELKEYKTAYSYYNFIENKNDLNSIDYLHLGLIKHNLFEYEEALSAYDKALEIDSKNLFALNNKAFLFIQNKKINEATVILNEALTIDNNFIYALHNKAIIAIYNLNYLEANRLINITFDLNQTFFYNYINRSHVYLKTGKLNEALEDINKSLELDPTNSYVYRNLGMYYIAISDKNNAVINLNKAKELDPSTLFLEELFEEANKLLPHSF